MTNEQTRNQAIENALTIVNDNIRDINEWWQLNEQLPTQEKYVVIVGGVRTLTRKKLPNGVFEVITENSVIPFLWKREHAISFKRMYIEKNTDGNIMGVTYEKFDEYAKRRLSTLNELQETLENLLS